MPLFTSKTYIPPAPQLQEYDPQQDPSRWTFWDVFWTRFPPKKQGEVWTKVGDVPESDDQKDWRGIARSQVKEWPMPDNHYFVEHRNNYFWFDTPDYADPFKKLSYLLKFNLLWGTLATGMFGFYKGHVKTVAGCLHLLKEIWTPMLATNMATGLTIVTVANLRGKKDDYYNYVAGAFVGTLILGRREHAHWFKATWTYIPPVLYCKYNAEENGHFIMRLNPREWFSWQTKPTAEHGFFSGDLRLGLRVTGNPGRDSW